MIYGWRSDRRIGPPSLLERMEVYWKPLALGLVAATALTPFLLWVKFGWPPKVGLGAWPWVWCWMFGIMMLSASAGLWQARLWLHLLVLMAISAGVIFLVAKFALPVGIALGFIPVILPITPVTP